MKSIFKAECPRCGHRSLYDYEDKTRCGWPDCDYPGEPRPHYSGFTLNDDGTMSVLQTMIPRSEAEGHEEKA